VTGSSFRPHRIHWRRQEEGPAGTRAICKEVDTAGRDTLLREKKNNPDYVANRATRRVFITHDGREWLFSISNLPKSFALLFYLMGFKKKKRLPSVANFLAPVSD